MENIKFMDKLTKFVEEKVAPPLIKLSQVRYLDALQKAFIILMPYMIVGAAATLILNLPGLFAEGNGLGLPEVQTFLSNIITPAKSWIGQISALSINLLAFLAAVLNGYFLGKYYANKDVRVNPIATAIVALLSFLCFIDFTQLSANFDYPNYILGAPNMFGAIIISIAAVEIYRLLVKANITIKMPQGVPQMIADAFTSIIPVTVCMIFFAILGRGIEGFDFLGMFSNFFAKLMVGGSSWIAQFIGFFFDRLLWFVGLHGSNVVGSVMTPFWEQMMVENMGAYAAGQPIPYMFTNQWINAYVRVSVFPIAVLLCMSKCKRYKTLGKLSIGGSIFNIAEPIMYGLPIVLNPLMFVPWVIGFCGCFLIQVFFSTIGLTPPIVASTVWTMPVPLMSFIGSGFNPVSLIAPIIEIVLVFLIFLPFFKILEKQELEKEKLGITNE